MTAEALQRDGFALVRGVIARNRCEELAEILDQRFRPPKPTEASSNYGVRDLLNRAPEIREFADSTEIRGLVVPLLGENVRPVRGIFFDKTREANWKVAWHQDLTIAVKGRVEVERFRAWTVKAGIPHVQPPDQILAGILTVRIHLDGTNSSNGALRVIPGSHLFGRLTAERIQALRTEADPVSCDAERGDVLLMRPLLLHASSAGTEPRRRRIIHLEFSAENLPGGMEWYGS